MKIRPGFYQQHMIKRCVLLNMLENNNFCWCAIRQ